MSKRIRITTDLPIPEPAPKVGQVLDVIDTNDRGWWTEYPAGRAVLVLYREASVVKDGGES